MIWAGSSTATVGCTTAVGAATPVVVTIGQDPLGQPVPSTVTLTSSATATGGAIYTTTLNLTAGVTVDVANTVVSSTNTGAAGIYANAAGMGGVAATVSDTTISQNGTSTDGIRATSTSATASSDIFVDVARTAISLSTAGPAANGIYANSATGTVTANVADTTIKDLRQNGASIGINLNVGVNNTTTTNSGVLNLSGTNNVTIGQFGNLDPTTGLPSLDPTTGRPTLGAAGNGGGILINVHNMGDATTTVTGQLNLFVNTAGVETIAGTGGSPGLNDAIETTVRAGTATLDMSNLDPGSSIYVNGGNGVFVDSLCQGAPNVTACTNPGSGGTIVVKGISSNLTITVDNTWYGSGWSGDALGTANAGILASSYGLTGTVAIESTGATINTYGPLADGIRAIAQGGNVDANPQGVGVYVNNSGNITTNGPASNGIEAASTNDTFAHSRYASGAIAMNPATNTGNVLVVNSGAITIKTTIGDRENEAGNLETLNTDPSNGIYAWSYSAGTGNSGNVTVNNLAGGNITTNGTYGDAIMAQSTSVGGIAGGVIVTNAATLETFGDAASGIYVQKKGGTPLNDVVVINTGTIVAHGDVAADAVTGEIFKSNGIEAQTGHGNITITNSGTVISDKAEAILVVTVDGNNLTITNAAGGTIFGATGISVGDTTTSLTTTGVPGLTSFEGLVEIDNSGFIGSSTDLAIDSRNLAADPLINNYAGAVITGVMMLGPGGNTLNNAGLWNLRSYDTNADLLSVAVSDFGTPVAGTTNTINNTGTIALLGAPVAGALVNSGGQYLPLGNSFNTMTVNGPVQGQILGVQTFTNSGIIDLTANPVAGDVLVISGGHTAGTDGGGVFVANGGTLRLNTVLNEGGANSQSDMLVVDSTRLGSAPTGIVVNNAGGMGAETVGDGIALVEVLNKGASADGVFALNGYVAAGAFEYALYHNGVGADAADGNWYLRSAIRPEVPVDTVVPALASRLGLAMLGSYSSRYGDADNSNFGSNFGAAQYCGDDAEIRKSDLYTKAPRRKVECNTLLWGRVFGETGSAGGGRGTNNGGFGSAGPAYSFDYGGFQAGSDLYRTARDGLGLYAGAATAQSNVRSAAGTPAGRLGLDAYGVGAYWSHRNPQGWYSDLVLQGNWYENIRTASVTGTNFHTRGWGITASAEAGYVYALGDGYRVIPQGQIIYQRTSIDSRADQYAQISFGSTDEVYARLGGRLAKDWPANSGGPVTTWMQANVWHQFGSNAQTTFATLQGDFPTSFGVGLGGTWAQVGLGLSGQLTRNVSIFGITDYNVALSQAGHSLGGRAGIKVAW